MSNTFVLSSDTVGTVRCILIGWFFKGSCKSWTNCLECYADERSSSDVLSRNLNSDPWAVQFIARKSTFQQKCSSDCENYIEVAVLSEVCGHVTE
jgi:hypothetical protein